MRYAQNLFYLGLGKQASKGTSVAPTIFPQYFDGDISMTPEISSQHYRPAGGQFHNLGLIQNIALPNSFTVLGTPAVAGNLFAMTMGADALTGAADPYTHAITFSERNSMPYHSVEVSAGYDAAQTDPIIVRFVDCRVTELAVSAKAGMPLMLNPTIRAIDLEKQASEATETFEADNPFVMHDGTFALDSGETSDITNFNLNIVNNVDEDDYTNDIKPNDLPVVSREATLSFTIKFADGTRFFDTYFASGHAALTTALLSGDFNVAFDNGVEASTEGYRALEIDIPSLDHISASIAPGTGDGTYEYSCEANVKLKAGSEFMTVTVNDATAEAYV